MDFIERWLGISPDGGNGSLEILYVVVLVAAIAAAAWKWKLRRKRLKAR